MKQVEKNRRESGMRISELAIVLAVTMVLSAILMPAIAGTTPDHTDSVLSASVQLDGLVQPRQSAENETKLSRRDSRFLTGTDHAARMDMDEYARASKGMKKMITTDIRHQRP
jgi:hypothetical protein